MATLERNQETDDVKQADYFCEQLEGFICHILNLYNVICDAIVNGLDGVEDDLIEQLISIVTYMKDLFDVLVHFTLPLDQLEANLVYVCSGGSRNYQWGVQGFRARSARRKFSGHAHTGVGRRVMRSLCPSC